MGGGVLWIWIGDTYFAVSLKLISFFFGSYLSIVPMSTTSPDFNYTPPPPIQYLLCSFAGFLEVRMVPGRPGLAFVEFDTEPHATVWGQYYYKCIIFESWAHADFCRLPRKPFRTSRSLPPTSFASHTPKKRKLPSNSVPLFLSYQGCVSFVLCIVQVFFPNAVLHEKVQRKCYRIYGYQ